MKPSFDGVVEPSDRAETSGKGDFRHRKTGFENQLSREIEPCRVMQLLGCAPERSIEEPSEMPRRDAQLISKRLFGIVFQPALRNEPHCPLHRGAGPDPSRRTGSRLGTAPQTGPISGCFGSLCRREELDILALGSSRADRTAIDAGRLHGHKKPSVETGVSCQHRLIAPLLARHHRDQVECGVRLSLYASLRSNSSRIRTCTAFLRFDILLSMVHSRLVV